VLNLERVRGRLPPTTRFTSIELLDVTDSTNRVVAARAVAGAPEGLVVAADLQTAGRGRLDRTWAADQGAALLVSILLRPQGLTADRWHLVTSACGLAARQACRQVGGFAPDLKWPNDLLLRDRKLAGILAETAGGGVVVGMGCNVHSGPPGSAWVDEAAGRRVDRSDLLGAWLAALDGSLGDWDAVAAEYAATSSTVGRRVRVDRPTGSGGPLVGVAETVDAAGRLVVRPDGGPPIAVPAGDVTHLQSLPETHTDRRHDGSGQGGTR
jgi:BirA family transcriptional regulator, biotin operon repressor / biotin---[acetyl-CoA-carboxylase] ligase